MIKKINNTSSTLIINAFEGFYYDGSSNINIAKAQLEEKYHLDKLLSIARKISKTIKTEILHESSHNFEPFGDSASLLIQADLSPYNNAVLHLKESHITFHTYIEDILNNFLIVRLELHISSCSESNIFDSLPEIISLNNQKNNVNKVGAHLINIDYLLRGAKHNTSTKQVIKEECTIDDMPFKNLFYDIYNISKQYENLATQHYSMAIKIENLTKSLIHSNENIPIKSILKLRKFLVESYIEETLDSKESKNYNRLFKNN